MDQATNEDADLPPEAAAAEALRAAFRDALELMGGAELLADWGHRNPTQFCAALARLLCGGARADRSALALMGPVGDTPLGSEPLSVEAWERRARAEAERGAPKV